jgi:hypothetical protein
MNQKLPRLASMMMLLLLIVGCGTKDDFKPAKIEPSRPVEVVIEATSLSQAKNNIMSACSAKRLQITTTTDEVTCTFNDLSGSRKRDIERFINDEYATNIQIVTKFKLLDQVTNVNVKANIYVQFLAPVSVMSGPQTRTRNLLDDVSFNDMSALLEQATKGGSSFK